MEKFIRQYQPTVIVKQVSRLWHDQIDPITKSGTVQYCSQLCSDNIVASVNQNDQQIGIPCWYKRYQNTIHKFDPDHNCLELLELLIMGTDLIKHIVAKWLKQQIQTGQYILFTFNIIHCGKQPNRHKTAFIKSTRLNCCFICGSTLTFNCFKWIIVCKTKPF